MTGEKGGEETPNMPGNHNYDNNRNIHNNNNNNNSNDESPKVKESDKAHLQISSESTPSSTTFSAGDATKFETRAHSTLTSTKGKSPTLQDKNIQVDNSYSHDNQHDSDNNSNSNSHSTSNSNSDHRAIHQEQKQNVHISKSGLVSVSTSSSSSDVCSITSQGSHKSSLSLSASTPHEKLPSSSGPTNQIHPQQQGISSITTTTTTTKECQPKKQQLLPPTMLPSTSLSSSTSKSISQQPQSKQIISTNKMMEPCQAYVSNTPTATQTTVAATTTTTTTDTATKQPRPRSNSVPIFPSSNTFSRLPSSSIFLTTPDSPPLPSSTNAPSQADSNANHSLSKTSSNDHQEVTTITTKPKLSSPPTTSPPSSSPSTTPPPQQSQSSSQSSKSLRRGKWTVEEEAYVARVIQDFNSGFLNAPAGTTLRTYLSDKLNCDPMRITKKFTGDSCIGKRVFHPIVRCTANATIIDTAQAELEALEKRWRRRLELQQKDSAKKQAASTASSSTPSTSILLLGSTNTTTQLSSPSVMGIHFPNISTTGMNMLHGSNSASNGSGTGRSAYLAQTASWLERANAILSSSSLTTTTKTSTQNSGVLNLQPFIEHDDNKQSHPNGVNEREGHDPKGTIIDNMQRCRSNMTNQDVQKEMEEVKRLIHEGPTIQKSSAGIQQMLFEGERTTTSGVTTPAAPLTNSTIVNATEEYAPTKRKVSTDVPSPSLVHNSEKLIMPSPQLVSRNDANSNGGNVKTFLLKERNNNAQQGMPPIHTTAKQKGPTTSAYTPNNNSNNMVLESSTPASPSFYSSTSSTSKGKRMKKSFSTGNVSTIAIHAPSTENPNTGKNNSCTLTAAEEDAATLMGFLSSLRRETAAATTSSSFGSTSFDHHANT